MWVVRSRETGRAVASFQLDPYSYTMRGSGNPSVKAVLDDVADATMVDSFRREGKGTSYERTVPADGDYKLADIYAALSGAYTITEADGNTVAAVEVSDDDMDYLQSLLDDVTDGDTSERTTNLWKAFLNRVVLRAISRADVSASDGTLNDFAADWTPALHPRDPRTGQFVERPFDVPDELLDMDTPDVVRELADEDPDFAEKVEGLQIDMDEDLQELVNDVSDSPLMDGSTNGAVETRAALDFAPKGESMDLIDVSEGDEVVVEWEHIGRSHAVAGTVAASGDNDGVAWARIERPGGETKEVSDNTGDGPNVYEAAGPVGPEPDLDLSGDRDEREQELQTFLKDHVVTDDVQTPSVGVDGIDDGKADVVLDNLAAWYADADPEIAEKWAASFRGLQLDGGARAGPAYANGDPGFYVNVGEQGSVQQHEAAHGLHYSYGLDAAGYPQKNGEKQLGIPTFKWDVQPVAQRYSLTGNDESPFADDLESVGIDDWKDRVERQSVNIGADDFDDIPENDLGNRPALHEDATEGTMVRFSKSLDRDDRQGLDDSEPHNYTIKSVERQGDRNFDAKVATLEGHGGRQYDIRIEADGSTKAVDRDTVGFIPDMDGIRQTTPDDWGLSKREPDEYLGSRDDLSGDDAAEHLFSKVNEAWYRQAVAARDGNDNSALVQSIGSGAYSVNNAPETLARLEEYASDTSGHGSGPQSAAHALVNYHPDLLEAYRQYRDIPEDFADRLDDELERAGADFRFNGGTQ